MEDSRTTFNAGAVQETDLIEQSWLEVLGRATEGRVEAADAELGFISAGGNSLRAARLAGLLHRRCGVAVPLSLLLRNASLADLHEFVRGASTETDTEPIEQGGLGGPAAAAPTSPLAPEQRRVWLLGRLHPDSSAYNVIAAVRLRGPLSLTTLQSSLNRVVERHDVLRAQVVQGRSGEPGWIYAPHGTLPIEVDSAPGELTGDLVDEFVRSNATTVIPDGSAPLARAALLRSARGDDACFVMVFNHLVADQTSVDLLLSELAAGYSAACRGERVPGEEAPAYSTYAREAVVRRATPEHRRDLEYWRTTLAGLPAELPLPFRKRRPRVPEFRGSAVSRPLAAEDSERLELLLRGRGLTPMSFFLASVATVLAAWSGQDDVVLGIPVSRRRSPAEQRLAGFLLDTVPLRLRVSPQVPAFDLAAQANERYVDAVAHSTPTFDDIVEHLGAPSRPGHNPVFQVWANDLTEAVEAPEFHGLSAALHPQPMVHALFDLGWYFWRTARGFEIQLVRSVELFTAEVAEELVEQVLRAVQQAIEEPQRAIGALELGGGQLLDPSAPQPRPTADEDLVAMFREVARERADATAVVSGPVRITYDELVSDVDRVAALLTEAEVPERSFVELAADRVASYPAALLGAWAHGVCPVIVDVATPRERLEAYRRCTGPDAVLTMPPAVERLSRPDGTRGAGELSHVLLTSGSSGRPLAVKVPRGPLANFVRWYASEFGPGPADRFALLAGVGHDPVLRDILVPLLAGAELHVPPATVFRDPEALAGWLDHSRVTVAHVTPALLEILTAGRGGVAGRLRHLRLVVCAGAPLTAGLARRFRRLSDAVLVNAYGTTETPQIAACQVVDDLDFPDETALPVGRGVAGQQVLVVTPAGGLAAPGQRGEIVVRGRHLAVGYAEPDPRTANRFRGDPAGSPGVRCFHTGDLGYVDLAGRVMVTGRGDRQVSIDGFRLELGEVESAAVSHPDVREAVAVLRSTEAGAALAVQVTAEAGTTPPAEAVRARMSAVLPAHAVPSIVEVVERIGLNANHKPEPTPPAGHAHATGHPRRHPTDSTGVGARIAALAEGVVGHPLDPDDNFFDAGMTSLLLVRFHERLIGELGLDMPITVLFTSVTLRALTRQVETGKGAPDPVSTNASSLGGGGTRDPRRLATAHREIRSRIRRMTG